MVSLDSIGCKITHLYNSCYISDEVPTIYKTTKYLLILLHVICKIYIGYYGLCMPLEIVA